MKMNQKMKKSVCALLLMIAGAMSASAIPAHPRPVDVRQSDGTKTLTLKLVGDEFHHYSATTDGYTVLQRGNGDYVYAVQSGERIVPSCVIAHNPQMRSAAEMKMVSSLQRGLTDKATVAQGMHMRSNRDKLMAPARTDYPNFRGLVVLIEYTDRSFTYGNDYFDDMMNKENYTGYYSSEGYFVPCTGSARDYYHDNSMGVFDPQFDVVGPVLVDYSSTTPQGYDNCGDIFVSAIDQLDSSVDFSQYDGDGDGLVDMIYLSWRAIQPISQVTTAAICGLISFICTIILMNCMTGCIWAVIPALARFTAGNTMDIPILTASGPSCTSSHCVGPGGPV